MFSYDLPHSYHSAIISGDLFPYPNDFSYKLSCPVGPYYKGKSYDELERGKHLDWEFKIAQENKTHIIIHIEQTIKCHPLWIYVSNTYC